MAIAEAHLAEVYNRPGHEIIDHYIYAIVTDGDLMEGVASEAASLAGHLRLGKLIYLYDDNHISIEGSTDLAFTEDRGKRFEAYGWHVQQVADGLDVEAIDRAIQAAKRDPRPSIIMVRNIIGYGLPTRAGTAKAHGEPPGDAELNGAKDKLGWPQEPRFYIPDEALAFFRQAVDDAAPSRKAPGRRSSRPTGPHTPTWPPSWSGGWRADCRTAGRTACPNSRRMRRACATRASSGKVINALAAKLPDLVGGSADLAPSTITWMTNSPAFAADCHEGRNFHFGVREHGMGAVVNGMAYHGGVIPFGATFLVFSDYMRPSAARGCHLAPGLDLGLYPRQHRRGRRWPDPPAGRAPGCAAGDPQPGGPAPGRRQRGARGVEGRDREPPPAHGAGAHAAEPAHAGPDASTRRQRACSGARTCWPTLATGKPQIILMASGSEVGLIVQAGQAPGGARALRSAWYPSRAGSCLPSRMPAYQDAVLPPDITARLAVEAGVSQGWHRWVGSKGRVLGLDRYGASAPPPRSLRNSA